MSILEEFEFVHQNKQDKESLIEQALVDVKRAIFRRMDALENMGCREQDEEYKIIGQLVASNLREHIESRHGDILEQVRTDNEPQSFVINLCDEHLKDDNNRRGIEFTALHAQKAGART